MRDNERAWYKFHMANKDVWRLFEKFALKAAGTHKRFGAMEIIQHIRWHTVVETRGSDYKINNNFSPYYARLFVRVHPEHEGMFKFRRVRGDGKYVQQAAQALMKREGQVPLL